MRRVFVFVLLVVFVFPLLAENASNVRVQQKGYRGDTVLITYDLSKTSDVRLLMSTDMSNDFNVLDQVTGHVGKGIAAGVNRTIMWFPLQEYDDRFYADNVRFQVEAVSNDLPLTVSKSQISAPSSGATEYITVTCSKPWVIQYASGSMYNAVRSGNSVKVVISANTSSARNDFFYIRTTDDAEKLKISLSQSGKVYSSSSSSRTSSSRPSSSRSSSSRPSSSRSSSLSSSASRPSSSRSLSSRSSDIKTYVMFQYGYSLTPQSSYGGLFGQVYDGLGWYVNARSNFKFNTPTELICDKDGMVDGVIPSYSGNKLMSHLTATAGFMWDIAEYYGWDYSTLGFYVGAGYGMRELQIETQDNQWVKYQPTSHMGFCGNLNFFCAAYDLMVVSVGVTTINFQYLDFEIGLGFKL